MQKTKQLNRSIKRARKAGIKVGHCRCTTPCQQTLPRLTAEQKATLLGDSKARCLSVPPGEGYRLVQPGEVVLATDETWFFDEAQWKSPGEAVTPYMTGQRLPAEYAPRRRKVSDDFSGAASAEAVEKVFSRQKPKPFFGPLLIVTEDGTKWSVNTFQELLEVVEKRQLSESNVWVRLDALESAVIAL